MKRTLDRAGGDGARTHGARLQNADGGRRSESERQSLSAILNLVRLGLANTRQEIERQLSLGRAVVADRLATLNKLGLIDESELGPATGGRAPRLSLGAPPPPLGRASDLRAHRRPGVGDVPAPVSPGGRPTGLGASSPMTDPMSEVAPEAPRYGRIVIETDDSSLRETSGRR